MNSCNRDNQRRTPVNAGPLPAPCHETNEQNLRRHPCTRRAHRGVITRHAESTRVATAAFTY
jgi:hypothetical protein